MQLKTNVVEEMEKWGMWVRGCPSKTLLYPSSQPFTVIKGAVGLGITDERAVEIDQAIAFLFGKDEVAVKAIKLRFVSGFGYRDIGSRLGISKERAQRLIDDSVSWITGYLFGKQAA